MIFTGKKLIILVIVTLLSTPVLAKIMGPGRISEDKEGTWRTNMVPKVLPNARAEILKYVWRFHGPGGGQKITKKPVVKWTYDTPADPVPNLLTCSMYYNVYIMQPGPPPTEVGPLMRRMKNAFKIKILDKTPPGGDVTGDPETPETLLMKTGEGPRENIFAIVRDNNPQFPGPYPELRKVQFYYQVGKYEYFRNFSEDNPDELTGYTYQVGPYFCNYPYSDITGPDEYQYPFTPEDTSLQQPVGVFSKTAPYDDNPVVPDDAVPDDGWPDAGFRWVGPIEMELTGPPIKIGEKFHVLKYTLDREKVIAPLRFSNSSKDWQILKAFITATDSSGNKMTCTYQDSLKASCGGNMFVVNFDVEDNDPPWLEVRVFSSREDEEIIIGMYPKTKFMFANMDEEWSWEDEYYMDPSEDGGSDSIKCFDSDKVLHEDVRYAFHFAANDNCNFTEDIFRSPPGQEGGIKLETAYFRIIRIMPGSGEENVIKEINGENDRTLGFIFKNPGEYIFEFFAEDYAGNSRLLKSRVRVGDTYITDGIMESTKQSEFHKD